MITTNNLGLPEAFVKAVSNVRHNKKGTLSATTLLQGTKQIVLFDRHFDELEQDAADLVWATFGTAYHAVMEKQEDDSFKEEYFETKVGDWLVTGRVDRYDLEKEILEDWKTASVWKVIFKSFDDWKAQGLTYAWLMKKAGLNVKKCRFVALLKDHSKKDAKFKPDYPQKPVYIYEFDVTEQDLEETEKRIISKIEQINAAYKQGDDDIEPCTPDERWETAPKYAVMKEGRKTAVKVFDTKEEAELMLSSLDDKHWLQERKGECKRCLDYCPCKDFCNFYKGLQIEN